MLARLLTLAVVACASTFTLGLAAPSANAADPAPFASTSGRCLQGAYKKRADFGPQAAAHPQALVRIETAAGPGSFTFYGEDDVFSERSRGGFGGADASWAGSFSIAAGATPWLALYCPGDANFDFRAELYDVPAAPTSYSGMSTVGGYGSTSSELFFSVLAGAPYVADVTLQQGSVELAGGGSSREFASSGTYSLGTLSRGLHSLSVTALDGSTSHWTITIHPQPVAVSAATFDRRTIRPGAITTASYELSADATVNATVVNGAGKELRHLASGLAAAGGKHTLRWDGFDDNGVPVADGVYRLKLTATDTVGTNASGEAQVTVDGHGPVVSPLSPTRIARTRAVSIRVTDTLSGLKTARLLIDGHQVMTDPTGVFVYRPQIGWRKGTHTLRVLAVDRLGNVSNFIRTLKIV